MISIDLFRNEEDTLSYAAGQTIFKQGDIGEAMYVVVEGKIALTVKGTLVEELEAGGLFGELALIDTAPRIATAVATTDCRLVAINEKRFRFLIQQTPHFALLVMRVIADRLRRMDSRL